MGTRNATLQIVMNLKGLMTNILNANKSARPSVPVEMKQALNLANGTVASQLDFLHCDQARSLLDTISENIDLFDLGALDVGAGAGKDLLGQDVTIAEIVALAIHVRPESTGELVVGGEGSAAAFKQFFNNTGVPADSSVTVKPGGLLLLAAPGDPAYPVTDTTDHLLKLEAAGGNVTYDILIAGRTA